MRKYRIELTKAERAKLLGIVIKDKVQTLTIVHAN